MMSEDGTEKTPLIDTGETSGGKKLSLNAALNYYGSTKTVETNSAPSVENVSGSTVSLDSEKALKKLSYANVELANFDRITLTWTDISVTSQNQSQNAIQSFFRQNKFKPLRRKQILKNVTGVAVPGRLVALMGASGAGKTTLLNVLTSRNTGKLKIEGEIRANGLTLGDAIRSISAYVQQDDLFFSTLTVKEHLELQADLRIGRNVTKKQREERVNHVMQELGLTTCANSLIGDNFKKTLSGGEKKRLAFASEVLTNPALMFCDEPTSGLDSFMAQQVVTVLKQLAQKGKTIICTIHQPSSQVFQMFDDLCLLADGQLAYMGPLQGAVDLFDKMKFPCPINFNPADHYIKTLAIVPGKERERKLRIKEFCRVYQESDVAEYIQGKANADDYAEDDMDYEIVEDNLSQTIQNINGVLFSFVTNMTMNFLFSCIHVFCLELPIFRREHFSHIYRVDAYYLAKNASELPQYIILPIIFTVILYFMTGLPSDPSVFFICLGINILTANVSVSLGYMISTMFADANLAMTVAPMFVTPFMLVGGFFINENTIPVYFVWLKYISYMKYSYEALAINEWETVHYIPGCENYACPINGTAVLQTLNFDSNFFVWDIIILLIMFFVIRLLGFLALLIRSYVDND